MVKNVRVIRKNVRPWEYIDGLEVVETVDEIIKTVRVKQLSLNEFKELRVNCLKDSYNFKIKDVSEQDLADKFDEELTRKTLKIRNSNGFEEVNNIYARIISDLDKSEVDENGVPIGASSMGCEAS